MAEVKINVRPEDQAAIANIFDNIVNLLRVGSFPGHLAEHVTQAVVFLSSMRTHMVLAPLTSEVAHVPAATD